ncbi:unnamed protein product [Protopolystoma xenopodis]|uniref:Dynein axonemal assembly factor 5 TPR repeats domain-containing protein n=1 Tax=Protopolystoma xenopodis TaxID=117903 RepID=A0A448X085_9PLAT|nr:unnamed protein product [Protopolystoma xenopodis]
MAPGALSSFPNINRVLNLIQDADKSKRRNAISIIKSEVDSKLAAKEAEDIETLLDILAPQLSHALSDTVESHREMIIEILMKLISEAECIEKLVPHLLPVLVRRVAEKESVEPAEELRFGYLTVLHNIVEKCKNNKSYSTEYMLILKSSVADSYPEVKKLAFLLLRILAIKLEQAFYVKSEDIIDPIVENITHQHSKIRQEAIKTIGVVMMNSPGKHVEKIIPPLTQRLFDPSPAVRKEVIDVVGSWLLNLTDRYSYHLRLIPLLLTGQQDEFYEIRELSRDLWHDVGIKFEKENEEQLKDKLDFPIAPPDFYPSYSRPNFALVII